MRLTTLLLAASFALPAAAQMPMQAPKKPSTSLTLVIAGKSTTFTLAQLAALPHQTVTVHNLHLDADETYSGVALADLLTANGARFDKTTQKQMLRSYLLATGSDGYSVLYSTVEVFPDYHTGAVIIADARAGKPIAPDGALKLINSADKHPLRWVQNLTTITLVAAP